MTAAPRRDRSRPKSVALILNNPFLTDSRAWKMARTLSSDGYDVTVVARAQAGLPATAQDDGFRVVRVAQFRLRPLPTFDLGHERGVCLQQLAREPVQPQMRRVRAGDA